MPFDAEFFLTLRERLPEFRYVDCDLGRHALESCGSSFAAEFLEIVSKGYDNFARLFGEEIANRLSGMDFGSMSLRSKDVLCSLTQRRKLVLSPFAGGWTTTDKAIGFETYWLEEHGRAMIITQFAPVLIPHADTVFIFPQEGLVLFFGKLNTKETLVGPIEELILSLAANPGATSSVVQRKEPAMLVGAVEMCAPHFGHYIWNALSPWEFLLPEFAHKIDFILSWNENKFVGKLPELYPEIAGKEYFSLNLSETHRLIDIAAERNAFFVFPKDKYISESLTRRVADWAWRTCPSQKRERLEDLRRSCEIVCVFGLRVSNRVWLEQDEGYIALAQALRSQFGSIGFLIDGMSADTHKGWTHWLMSLDEEKALARKIAASIADFAPCIDLVAETMAESIVGVEISDFFVGPAGSGMTKYKWLSNKPGIVIANPVVLDMLSPNGWVVRVFENDRDNIIKSIFIDKNFSEGTAVGHRDGDIHEDFHMDWHHIFDAIIKNRSYLAPLKHEGSDAISLATHQT